MSITHNKKRIPLLNLLINYISARSAPQILSIKDECTFIFVIFLIIGLCNSSANSSANSLLEIFSFLTVPPEVLLSKKLYTIEARHLYIHHILDF